MGNTQLYFKDSENLKLQTITYSGITKERNVQATLVFETHKTDNHFLMDELLNCLLSKKLNITNKEFRKLYPEFLVK